MTEICLVLLFNTTPCSLRHILRILKEQTVAAAGDTYVPEATVCTRDLQPAPISDGANTLHAWASCSCVYMCSLPSGAHSAKLVYCCGLCV